jgi:hypothetical protein
VKGRGARHAEFLKQATGQSGLKHGHPPTLTNFVWAAAEPAEFSHWCIDVASRNALARGKSTSVQADFFVCGVIFSLYSLILLPFRDIFADFIAILGKFRASSLGASFL